MTTWDFNKFSDTEINERLTIRSLALHSGYIDSKNRFNVYCLVCGFVFSTRLYENRTCPSCDVRERFERDIAKIEDLGFFYISGEYQNRLSDLVFLCGGCGREFTSNAKRLIKGQGCARCSKKEKLSINKIRELVSEKPLELLSLDYVNSSSKLTWRCLNCDTVFEMNWNNIREGHGCWQCGLMTGEKNPNWRGGIKPVYPREFNESLKEEIRNRDNRKCQYPGCDYDDTKEDLRLHVHHIDRNKNNCSPINLVSLCKYHHRRVESRPEWMEYFYSITSDYVYS